MKNILVVEDSESTRSMMKAVIEDLGEDYLVFEAGTGFEALKLLPAEAFSLIITDINMPDINGIELISFVKSTPQYRGIPVIIVSTEGSEEDRRRGLALGAEAYITKPFKPEDLQEKIRVVLSP
ncbi:MAG TPA: response regulator [Nitrospirae bacterium]|nr:response regulator [Nitrospirota bacterium]